MQATIAEVRSGVRKQKKRPVLGAAYLLNLRRQVDFKGIVTGGLGRNRTADTRIFNSAGILPYLNDL